MLKISEAQRTLLKAPLPTEAISQHPTKTYLSTIKAIYVLERLNDVFGVGEWNISNEVIPSQSPKWVVVKSTFTVNGYGIKIEQFGGNDNADPGDAHKGAATDALTKIGSYLEIGIDVFKRIKDKPKSESKNEASATNSKTYPEDNKPWINDAQVKKVIERIQLGEVELKETVAKEFKISRANKEKIMAA